MIHTYMYVATQVNYKRFFVFSTVEYIIRSHKVKDNGYEVDHNGKCSDL